MKLPPSDFSSAATIRALTLPASVTGVEAGMSPASTPPEFSIACGEVQSTTMSAPSTALFKSHDSRHPGSAADTAGRDSSRRVHSETFHGNPPRCNAMASDPPMRPGPRIATVRLRAPERSYPSKGISPRCREETRARPHIRRKASGGSSQNRASREPEFHRASRGSACPMSARVSGSE